jgi:adenylate cyclase
MRLTSAELAHEAETTRPRIDRLVAYGIVKAGDDGLFGAGDIQRARLVEAFEGAGITIEQLGRAIADHQTNFESVESFYPEPSRRSRRTYEMFAASLGARRHLLEQVHAAMGLTEPSPERSLTERDEATINGLLDAWDLGDDDVVSRAAKIMGDAAHHAAEGWVDLFYEQVSEPVERRAIQQRQPVEAVIPQIVPAASRVAALAPEMLDWLLGRHLEQVLYARNIDSAEAQFRGRGMMPSPPAELPAIVFADLTGFTHLTQTMGDQEATMIAVRLGETARVIAKRHGGRMVKLLGDGVLLRFGDARSAVMGALDLVEEGPRATLPPIHAGVHAGPLILRDGDVFGHTVNLAARVAGAATADQVVATSDVVAALSSDAVAFEAMGPTELKGVAEAIELHRVVRIP